MEFQIKQPVMPKTIFTTNDTESLYTRFYRIGFNLFPAYRRTSGRICFISHDWKEIHVRLGLSWKTRNYVGTVFGGSIYGALDPIFMIQLIKILGDDFIVWDKAANIKFIKPIKKKVFARFIITDEIIEDIISKIKTNKRYTVDLTTNFQDEKGIVYAEVIKNLYIADKQYYIERKRS